VVRICQPDVAQQAAADEIIALPLSGSGKEVRVCNEPSRLRARQLGIAPGVLPIDLDRSGRDDFF
jgi:hypothetical protein